MSSQTRRALQGFSFQSIGRMAQSPTIFALLTSAALASSAATVAAAEPATNPGHALAQRFAEDSERARAAEAAKQESARKATAQRRKQEADKSVQDKRQKSLEDEMIARARAEAEERRQLEAEAARLDGLRAAREAKEAEAARQVSAKREAEEARVIEEARKADETKRAAELAAAEEARKVAEARRIAEAKELEARRIEAERLAEATRRAQNERLADEARRAEVQRIEAARRAEEAARVAAEVRKAEQAAEARKAEQVAEARRAEQAARIAEEAKRTEDSRRDIKRATDEDMRRVGALEIDAEVDRVAARLRAIREQHMARHVRPEERSPETPTVAPTPTPSNVPTGAIGRLGVLPPPVTAPETRASDRADAAEVHQAADLKTPEDRSYHSGYHNGRVTILLQMDPIAQRGRRHESMDPILCVTDGCYVSNGPHQPASFMPGRRATRFGNAISRRAGACNHAYTCVFRDIEIGALPAEVQPVDIRVLRHDRRTPETIETLSTCRGSDNRLACTGVIQGDGFKMWVIPESVAARLPVDVFGSTVESNLGRQPYAAVAPRRERW